MTPALRAQLARELAAADEVSAATRRIHAVAGNPAWQHVTDPALRREQQREALGPFCMRRRAATRCLSRFRTLPDCWRNACRPAGLPQARPAEKAGPKHGNI